MVSDCDWYMRETTGSWSARYDDMGCWYYRLREERRAMENNSASRSGKAAVAIYQPVRLHASLQVQRRSTNLEKQTRIVALSSGVAKAWTLEEPSTSCKDPCKVTNTSLLSALLGTSHPALARPLLVSGTWETEKETAAYESKSQPRNAYDFLPSYSSTGRNVGLNWSFRVE
jgi:hypothetical protein